MVRVERIRDEAPDVRSFEFVAADAQSLPAWTEAKTRGG